MVFYGYAPALGFWLMKLYGHRDVRILDCSRDTWRAEGRPWSTAAANRRPGGYHLGDEDPGIRADRAAVSDAIAQPGIDAGRCSFRGRVPGRALLAVGRHGAGRPRRSHSLGRSPAHRRPLRRPTGRSAPRPSCAASSRRSILDGDDELITYCTIGGRAATAWFVLTYLLGRDQRSASTTAHGPSGAVRRHARRSVPNP